MVFLRGIFYSVWLRVGLYIVIGIGVNTAPPHYPQISSSESWTTGLHSIVQFIISVGLFPLSWWHPEFTVGKWTP